MTRGWDDPWQRYPASKPLPVEGGVRTTRQRGPMAEQWWSRRFVEVLESYGLGARMQRGRRYARTGQVLELQVSPGLVGAQVQGSRPRPYLVTVGVPLPGEAGWDAIVEAMGAKVGFVARLLDGEVPAEMEEVFADAGVPLFPRAWSDVRATCSCPDPENPCKHLAAVLYVLADRLDRDPWLLLELRGRDRDSLLEVLTARGPGGAVEAIAPWWPFASGPIPLGGGAPALVDAAGPERPDAVLDTLQPLAVDVGTAGFVALLRPVYDTLG